MVLAGLAVGVLFYKVMSAPPKLYGKDITYQATYKSSSEIITIGKTTLFSDCTKKVTTLTVTEDTVEFNVGGKKIGYKPITVIDSTKLVCMGKDSSFVFLQKFLPKSQKKDWLFYQAGPHLLVFSPNAECIEDLE